MRNQQKRTLSYEQVIAVLEAANFVVPSPPTTLAEYKEKTPQLVKFKGSKDKIKRPSNSWIVFRAMVSAALKELEFTIEGQKVFLEQGIVSSVASTYWAEADKGIWDEAAVMLSKVHKRMYSNYVFRPQTRAKDRKTDGRRIESTTTSGTGAKKGRGATSRQTLSSSASSAYHTLSLDSFYPVSSSSSGHCAVLVPSSWSNYGTGPGATPSSLNTIEASNQSTAVPQGFHQRSRPPMEGPKPPAPSTSSLADEQTVMPATPAQIAQHNLVQKTQLGLHHQATGNERTYFYNHQLHPDIRPLQQPLFNPSLSRNTNSYGGTTTLPLVYNPAGSSTSNLGHNLCQMNPMIGVGQLSIQQPPRFQTQPGPSSLAQHQGHVNDTFNTWNFESTTIDPALLNLRGSSNHQFYPHPNQLPPYYHAHSRSANEIRRTALAGYVPFFDQATVSASEKPNRELFYNDRLGYIS
ncbi:hypothetical protein CVT24_008588 [Panaeolus cyanescens]|uniref:HMG box domain-containing protein n=1 Tax=Panaeolus cyanescens TaxID=181874 RepID=A0A409W4F0_9AGAR|nr:hypothetical protein CVT24_008588 [Panaeolus cyanescens]